MYAGTYVRTLLPIDARPSAGSYLRNTCHEVLKRRILGSPVSRNPRERTREVRRYLTSRFRDGNDGNRGIVRVLGRILQDRREQLELNERVVRSNDELTEKRTWCVVFHAKIDCTIYFALFIQPAMAGRLIINRPTVCAQCERKAQPISIPPTTFDEARSSKKNHWWR